MKVHQLIRRAGVLCRAVKSPRKINGAIFDDFWIFQSLVEYIYPAKNDTQHLLIALFLTMFTLQTFRLYENETGFKQIAVCSGICRRPASSFHFDTHCGRHVFSGTGFINSSY